jgi:hypothetical protein
VKLLTKKLLTLWLQLALVAVVVALLKVTALHVVVTAHVSKNKL